MSPLDKPARIVGNEMFAPRPRLQMVGASGIIVPPKPAILSIPVTPADDFPYTVTVRTAAIMSTHTSHAPAIRGGRFSWIHKSVNFAHQYSAATFALLILLVGGTGARVYGDYRSAQILASTPQPRINRSIIHTGLNTMVPTDLLVPTLQKISGQTISLNIAGQSDTLGSNTIKGWLQVVTDQNSHVSYIHVNELAIATTLQAVAQKYSKSPLNQVSVTHNNVSSVIYGGQEGLQVAAPNDLAKTIGRNLLEAKGFQAPLNASPVAFQSVTPAAFAKMIEVNVVTKQMYLYQDGQLYKSYPISAGAPDTPTPLGQYRIFSKYAVQDMDGFNPNGTKYFQPHVRWINYFLPGGYAVHGNYWRPSSWFGVINSSHGCVSLPDAQAKEVYDWTQIGTTVVTHS